MTVQQTVRLRFALIALLALSWFLVSPRPAAAQPFIGVSADLPATGQVGVPVLLFISIYTGVDDPGYTGEDETLTYSFDSAEAGLFTSTEVANPCGGTITANGDGWTISKQMAPAVGCNFFFELTFSEAGTYTIADFVTSADVDGTDISDQALETYNIVIAPAVTPTPEPTPEPEPVAAPVATVCAETPDMAVSPQFIELAPGGRATVEVAMRNLCADVPTTSGDLLMSFSDGLSVVETTDGFIALGQRAALQNFTLAAGETRRWTITVEAGSDAADAATHITEYFTGGRVASRIDGVFVAPAPTAAAEAAAPVIEVVPVAEVPAAPVTLPNTSATGSMLPQLLSALAAAAAGLALRRRA
jgi:hypothetical protein